MEDGKNSEGWRGRDLKGGVHLYMAIDRDRLTGHGSGKRAVARGREQSTWDSVWQGREGYFAEGGFGKEVGKRKV